jgi:hypothetical protein
MEERKQVNQDIVLHCEDCDKDFVFTVGEQQFFYSKGLSTPKRCQPCRKYRKSTIMRDDRCNNGN